MPRTFEYKDPSRVELIAQLQQAASKEKAGLWDSVAQDLARSRKNRSEVNIYHLNKHTAGGDVVVVPGKVLGDGVLEHKIDVAAYRFTPSAAKKIAEAGGRALNITELMKSNPTGTKVKIIG